MFICGGAFEGLEEIIKQRIERSTIGFDAKGTKKQDKTHYLSQIAPEDLMKYGLIPEFIGRLPVLRTLEPLAEDSLIQIMTEPKNSLIKQYQAVFDMEGVKLTFDPKAIRAIAKKGIERETGARGLRSIMEETMIDLMYEIPSMKGVQEVIISEEVVNLNSRPVINYLSNKDQKVPSRSKKKKKNDNGENLLIEPDKLA